MAENTAIKWTDHIGMPCIGFTQVLIGSDL